MNPPESDNGSAPETRLENRKAMDFILDSQHPEASFSFQESSVRCRLQPNGSIEMVHFIHGEDMGPTGFRAIETATLSPERTPDKRSTLGPFTVKLKTIRAKSKFGPFRIGSVHELVIVAHGLKDSPGEKEVHRGRAGTGKDIKKLLGAQAGAERIEGKGATVFVHDAEGAPETDASEMDTVRSVPAKPDQKAMRTQRIPRAKKK